MHLLNIVWMIIKKDCPRLVVSSGEPAGIGPDILIQAAQQSIDADLVIIADPDLLLQRASMLGLPINLIEFDSHLPPIVHQPGSLKIIPIPMESLCIPGMLNTANARYVLALLDTGCQGCLNNTFAGMITAPVNKAIINEAGFPFSGHTEYLASCCGTGYPVMMLANPDLRIALVTTHLPLSRVSDAITAKRLEAVLTVVCHDLINRFAIDKPRLLVCGPNPHAGEEGHLGNEERRVIVPVLEKLRGRGMRLIGPVSADTAFTKEQAQKADVIICMYHDQGLPVVKAQGFGNTVNVTLGLPIIRTSVDHGTALSLAGSGKTNCTSLLTAIDFAIKLSRTTNTTLSSIQNYSQFTQAS